MIVKCYIGSFKDSDFSHLLTQWLNKKAAITMLEGDCIECMGNTFQVVEFNKHETKILFRHVKDVEVYQ